MKKTLVGLSIAALASMHAAAENTYQFEGNLSLGKQDVDTGNSSADVTVDSTDAVATIYFSPVNTDKGPLSEAAFLDKASSVSIIYSLQEVEAKASIGGQEFKAESEADNYAIGFRYITQGDFIVEGAFADSKDGDLDSTALTLGVGTYIDDTSDIVLTYVRTTTDFGSDDINTDSLTLDYHKVQKLDDSASIAYEVGLGYTDVDSEANGQTLAGALTYYPQNNFGFGAGFGYSSIEDFTSTSYSLFAEYYFNSQFAVNVDYSSSEDDVKGRESDESSGFSIGATFRF